MAAFVELAQQCAPLVDPNTMAAIVRHESGFNPLAIGINGGYRLSRQPASKEEAVVTARWLINNGYSVDMGLGQINSLNLPRLGITVEEVFDPCRNLAAASKILHSFYTAARKSAPDDQTALRAALSAYNTGNFTGGFHSGYVQKVVGSVGGTAGVPIRVVPAGASSLKNTASRLMVF